MKKKIAVFHSFLDNIGGAEVVTLTLARELDADIYTTNIDKVSIKKMGFSANRIFSIGKVPINAPFRQQMTLWKFSRLNLGREYDLYIIAGDWAVSLALHNKPNLWYAHSPIREIWDLYEDVRRTATHPPLRYFFDLWVYYNRNLNRKYANQVDKIVCNSENTKQRIKKYLNKDAVVINPPAETAKLHYKETGDYWLSVNRLFYHKRVALQLKAFGKLPDERLIIVGCYEKARHFKSYANYCQRIKPKNVEILSWVDREKLIDLYANCKGFIATAQDEDFGITPVEAMASGKPVIAPNEGGYKETIIDNITGKLVDDINVDKLVKAIKGVGEDPQRYKDSCMNQAKKFGIDIFINKIKREIERCIK